MQVPTQQLLCSERVEPRADYRLLQEIHFKNKYFMGFGLVFFPVIRLTPPKITTFLYSTTSEGYEYLLFCYPIQLGI